MTQLLGLSCHLGLASTLFAGAIFYESEAPNVAARSGSLIALLIGMDYDKMKALLEASREESAVQSKAKVKEFPKPDSVPDWKYLGYVAKEQKAA